MSYFVINASVIGITLQYLVKVRIPVKNIRAQGVKR